RARADVRARAGAWPDRTWQGLRARGRRARRPRHAHLRGGAMISRASNGSHISVTGLGRHVPEHVVTNDDLSKLVRTSDEWIVERTGIRERHVAGPDEAVSDICLPAACEALERARVEPAALDLIVVATVTPDMIFPSTGAILANALGATHAAAYDLSA